MQRKETNRRNPLTKRVIKFFAIWHCALHIPILISLFLPWYDGANWFELAFGPQDFPGTDGPFLVAIFLIWSGIPLWVPTILCISAAFDQDLIRARRKLQYACISFIFVPFFFVYPVIALWGIHGRQGCGGNLFFFILFPIYSFIALAYIVFLIIADIFKYFPREVNGKFYLKSKNLKFR